VPDWLFAFTICHLTLSVDPLAKAPLVSVEVLFIIVPLEIVDSTNGDKPVVGPPDPVAINELVAAV
jgi:hypothetical protein